MLPVLFVVSFIIGCTDKPSEVCSEYEYQVIADGDERTCVALTSCEVTEYESIAPTETSDRTCSPLTNCEAGEYVFVAPTDVTDRECKACSVGVDYSTTMNVAACTSVTECASHEYISESATTLSDVECSDCQTDVEIAYGTCLECDDASTCLVADCQQGYTDAEGTCILAPVPENSECTIDDDTNLLDCSCKDGYFGIIVWYADLMSWTGSCSRWTDCLLGEFVAVDGTSTTDRYCLPCLEGVNFTDMVNTSECVPLTECQAGEYIEHVATTQSDRTCAACTDGVNFSSVSNTAQCMPVSDCASGEYVLAEPTLITDRVCAPCVEGANFSAGTNATECTPLLDCLPGEYVSTEATVFTDRICDSCTDGVEYSTLYNSTTCTPISDCLAGEYVLVDSNATADRICAPCTEGTNFSDVLNAPECMPVSHCNAGEYVLAEPTLFADRECQSCTLDTDYSTLINSPTCTALTICGPGEYVETSATVVSDRLCDSCTLGVEYSDSINAAECTPISDCSAGEYILATPTLTSDRECNVCSVGTLSTESNAIQCSSWTDCAAGAFVLVDGTPSSDRECESCTLGVDFSSTINATSCTLTQDCLPGQYVATDPSVVSDRQCDDCFLNTNFSDGVNALECTSVTECAANEYEIIPADIDQDRICEVLTVSMVVVDDEAYEGGQDTASVQLVLSAPQQEDISIFFTEGGSAEQGQDYEMLVDGLSTTSPVVIPAGESFVELIVEPIVTSELEVVESLTLSIEEDAEYDVDTLSSGEISIYEYGPSTGEVYFVDVNGDDNNVGDESNPFATIGYAVNQLSAGDTLYIKDGTYTNDGYVSTHGTSGTQNIANPLIAKVSASGTADNWIKIAAYPDGNDIRPLLQFDGLGGIEINQGEQYIIIEGLEIEGPNKEIEYAWAEHHRWTKENFYKGRGIYTWGPVDHIVVRDCNVHHTPGSGIRFNKGDYIMVERNIVSNTTWWSSSAESAIVIATAESIDTEDVVKFLYSGNVVYNNWNFLEFCSTPLRNSTADEYGNCDYYTGGIIDGQGLYVTRNNQTYTHGRMRFENNIAFNNGFGGVVYHKTDRGELINNLVFMNGAYPGLSNYTGLTVNTSDDLIIRNNIVWARESDDYAIKNNGNASNVVATHNYVVGTSQFGSSQDNTIIAFTDAEDLSVFFQNAVDISVAHPDPHATTGDYAPANIDDLIQSYGLDFYPLTPAVELIDAGTSLDAPNSDIDNVLRPQGLGVDIGPYELP